MTLDEAKQILNVADLNDLEAIQVISILALVLCQDPPITRDFLLLSSCVNLVWTIYRHWVNIGMLGNMDWAILIMPYVSDFNIGENIGNIFNIDNINTNFGVI